MKRFQWWQSFFTSCWQNFRKPGELNSLLRIGDLLSETRYFKSCLERVKKSPEGNSLVREQYRRKIPELSSLQSYPIGTLGHDFAQFVQKNGLNIYDRQLEGDKLVYLRERSRVIHDILHTVFDYSIELFDEAALNTMLWVQVRYPISLLIICGALARTAILCPGKLPQFFRTLAIARKRALQIKPLFGFRFEEYWNIPTAQVRRALEISHQ